MTYPLCLHAWGGAGYYLFGILKFHLEKKEFLLQSGRDWGYKTIRSEISWHMFREKAVENACRKGLCMEMRRDQRKSYQIRLTVLANQVEETCISEKLLTFMKKKAIIFTWCFCCLPFVQLWRNQGEEVQEEALHGTPANLDWMYCSWFVRNIMGKEFPCHFCRLLVFTPGNFCLLAINTTRTETLPTNPFIKSRSHRHSTPGSSRNR